MEEPKTLSYDWQYGREELFLQIDGYGEDDNLYIGLYHMEAFPIDVWIKRAMKEHFPPDFDPAVLGEYAGLAQQYLFFHARSTGL